MAGPIPDLNLSLGISPYSQATNGLDYFTGGTAGIGSVNFGVGDTSVSPVIKDAATAIAVIIGAVFLWKQVMR